MRFAVAIALAGLAALAACKRDSSLYCDTDNTMCPPGYFCETGQRICVELVDGAVIPCDQTHPCVEDPQLPYCMGGVCVECGGDSDCDDNPLPVCGPNNTCVACVDDDECAADGSGVCMYDGTCAEPNTVIYTDPGGPASGTCTSQTPCDLDFGTTLVSATRNIIHLAPGLHDTATSIDPPMSATLIGRGAEIRYVGGPDDNVLELDGSGPETFGLYYLEIDGGRGLSTQGSGVRCQGATLTARELTIHNNDNMGLLLNPCDADVADIRVTDNNVDGVRVVDGHVTIARAEIFSNDAFGVHTQGGTVTVRRSIVRVNNDGGFELAGGPHLIENNLIIANGSGGSQVGGVRFGVGTGHTFRFNTLAGNTNMPGTNTGMSCADALEGSSNLFDDSVDTDCVQSYSLFTTGAGPAPPGGLLNVTGVADPMFLDTTNPAAAGYFRIDGGSMAVNAAEDIPAVTDDVDGDPRPSASNAARDIGADEVQ